MSRLRTLTVTSHRGRRYPLELFSTDTTFTDTGAVYLYLANGHAGEACVLYVGDARRLARQLGADRRPGGVWHRARAMGFDMIGALAMARPEDRQMIARDFVLSWAPSCNAVAPTLGGALRTMPPPFVPIRFGTTG